MTTDPQPHRGSFGWYCAIDIAQDAERKNRPLPMPVTGHCLAEESPEELLAALTPFLAPYREATAPVAVASSH